MMYSAQQLDGLLDLIVEAVLRDLQNETAPTAAPCELGRENRTCAACGELAVGRGAGGRAVSSR